MDQRPALRPSSRSASGRLLLAAAILAMTASVVGPAAHPATTNAATLSPSQDSVETTLLGWINNARASKGLKALRLHPGLVKMSDAWAAHMASTGVLALPSCTSCMLSDYGVQKYNYGSIASWSTYNWGSEAANSIWQGWKQHSTQWAKLMSGTLNYIGIGIYYKTSTERTWSAVFLTESKDRTSPWAKTAGASRSGSTVSWAWSGGDTALQSHTSGLKNFDVQYRVDNGTWTTLKSGTTAKSLSLTGRNRGHYYGIRVRSRDNRDYVSGWTAEMRVWVP